MKKQNWQDHIAGMQEDPIPMRFLFEWLPYLRPRHGCKLRWKGRIGKYLKRFKIDEVAGYICKGERSLESKM